MRRLAAIFGLFLLTLALLYTPPTMIQGQFATNTPDGDAQSSSQDDNAIFATNTPNNATAAPTLTPSATFAPTETPTLTPTPSATPTQTPTLTPTPIGPYSYPSGINPLTGLPYPNEAAIARRNMILKISNFPPIVRPQSGVNQADVVFEYEAEGGVTRFAALYRSQSPERVGSIRSARLLDIELVTMYQTLLGYSGTSEPIQELLLASDFRFQLISPSIGDNCLEAGFCRDQSLRDQGYPLEHTLFAEPDKVWERATARNVNTGYIARGFAFSEDRDPNGEPVADVFLDWFGQTDARWQYDAESGRYLRYTDSVPHYDALDGEQLWADNIIIIQAQHERRPDLFPPGANYESLEVRLWNQDDFYQQAVVLRDGVMYQGFWWRRNREPGTALQVIYGDNTPIKLKPGRTWVAIMRGFGDVSFSTVREEMPDDEFTPPGAEPTLVGVG